ncbi:microspherule protein 1 [Clonorchis sinensis]|uniref:Microspherule protein 1 n=1 Tax=Clonorchis sinensis TaxID=79923 RepID=H2KS86_CLOSI|nr:microspherule protein 1 [Clonorchis sinensis]
MRIFQHFLPNLHRVSPSYLRSRSRRRPLTRSRQTQRSTALVAEKEPKITAWLPGDDYLLINSVVMTCNLSEVYHTVRFAHFYTEKEVEARWRALLLDPLASRTALAAINKISPALKSQLDRQIPFSSLEDNLLTQISFSDVYTDQEMKPLLLEDLRNSVFSKLLREHPSVFYCGRDEFDLFRQWSRLKSCHVIRDSAKTTRSTPPDDSSPKGSTETSNHDKKPMTSNTDSLPCGNSFSNTPLGGDPTSFSDTELLLEETVHTALASGLDKLSETSTAARRRHMLGQSSYHGFQALVTENVLAALTKESREFDGHSSSASTHPSRGSTSPFLPEARSQNSVARPTHRNGAFSTSHRTFSRDHPYTAYRNQSAAKSIASCADFELQRRLELYRKRRRLWARLRRTAEEAKRWTALVEVRASNGLELTDPQPIYPALAALTGTRTRFLIKEKEVTFGRSSFVYKPHIDLSREGDSARVSRCHGRIRLMPDGAFWLANFSPHPVFVDGNPVLADEEVELRDLATVVVAHMTFRFDINQLYVNSLCGGGTAPSEDANDPKSSTNSDAPCSLLDGRPSPSPPSDRSVKRCDESSQI